MGSSKFLNQHKRLHLSREVTLGYAHLKWFISVSKFLTFWKSFLISKLEDIKRVKNILLTVHCTVQYGSTRTEGMTKFNVTGKTERYTQHIHTFGNWVDIFDTIVCVYFQTMEKKIKFRFQGSKY